MGYDPRTSAVGGVRENRTGVKTGATGAIFQLRKG